MAETVTMMMKRRRRERRLNKRRRLKRRRGGDGVVEGEEGRKEGEAVCFLVKRPDRCKLAGMGATFAALRCRWMKNAVREKVKVPATSSRIYTFYLLGTLDRCRRRALISCDPVI
ncbi:hypothetical protein Dda_1813 [Drechslerella dactyloides]|uniref:Uncharacterized protein n=1 Tax=Drechslerella dactyloides TaxID=74499 RepID=A0AAD6J3R9_DREDA|nr:hypothetical protein Dda_1813 [Drechslerella dactyloides]